MITKARLNFILSLQKRKTREEEKLYVVEGDKLVKEFLEARVKIQMLVAKPEFLNSLPLVLKQGVGEFIQASYDELKKVSSLKTPHNALAVISMPEKKINTESLKKGLSVAIECIQDPGNLGTVIRSAAWFGIKNIYCSSDSVDAFNPKVIQATMGAILHVNVFYTDLHALFEKAAENSIRIFGALLEGQSVYSCKISNNGIILLGNESRGISEDLQPFITDRIMIPRSDRTGPGIDSLNVAMAASVIFSEFTRSKGREQ
jgi:TrmH family RNA methyltransferase